MSFKNVRDLAEHLKLLGFPHVFPLQALATTHGSLASFHIVAELLQWLAGLLEPGALLPGGTATEEERILLIRSATEFFVTKSAIRLNPRKLYAASAVTATELQKITRLLIAPTQSIEEKDDEEQNYRSLNQVDIGDKMEELRRARELSSDLTQRGATLHDLLAKELMNKEARLAQANRPMELISVERTLKNAIAAAQVKLQSNRAQLENLRVELNALNSKLQRKRAELERTKQRLEALQKIRPAHMQEFEDCEKELQQLFQKYFLCVHVRDALRAQLEARNKRATPVSSPLLQKPAENSMPFIPDGLMVDDDDDDDDDDDGGQLDATGIRRSNFGLDAEIPDIRDEDLILRNGSRGTTDVHIAAKRPSTATIRTRPTTGRNRAVATAAAAGAGAGGNAITAAAGSTNLNQNTRNGRDGVAMLNTRGGRSINDNDDNSTFDSSESDLDMGDIMSMSGLGSIDDSNIGVVSNTNGMGVNDDDFDLNSIDDISISKLTGELPLRPKTANKQEHHSDEDF